MLNYRYHAVRTNNVAFDFSVADFPLMNVYDLISVARILKGTDASKLHLINKEDFLHGFTQSKLFIDNYYEYLALTDIELVLAINKKITVPQSM